MKTIPKKRSSPLKKVSVSVLVVLLFTGGIYLVHRHYEKPEAKTTSKAVTAQNNFTGGKKRSTSSGDASQGGATDNHGKTTTLTTNQSQWAISASGDITLESPIANGTMQTGYTIEGTAKVSLVQYRLVDANTGVIAQGSLNVVNGAFSGTLQFQSHATTGQLDIFSYNSSDVEINNINLPVKFN
jgi:hypothetical protein